MDFWRLLAILGKRKWLIVFSGIAGALLMWGATRLVGSRWAATIDFVMPGGFGQTIPGAGTDAGAATPDTGRNQALLFTTLVKSQAVIEPVLKTLDQTQVPPDLLSNIDFASTGPSMYQLEVSDASPTRATQLANALGEQFIRVYHDINTQQAARAVHLLSTQMHTTDVALAQARDRYDQYRREHRIIGNLNGSVDTALSALRLAIQKRDAAQVQSADLRARLQSLEALMAQIPPLPPAEVMAAGPYAQEQQDLAKAEDQLAQLRLRYTDAMPAVQTAIATRDAIAKRLQDQWARDGHSLAHQQNASLVSLENETRTVKQSLAGSDAQAKILSDEALQARVDFNKFNGVDMPVNMLGSDVAEKSEERNGLAERLSGARQALDVAERQNPIAMMDHVDEFNPPVNTTRGRTLKLIVLAALASLLCSCAIIITLDSVDRRLKTVRQAELALPRGILAAIPQPIGLMDYATMARTTELAPCSQVAEAYRFLALHLLNNSSARARSILVLAAKAEQGSTTTLTNLGITLAQAGKRVLIVDANVRTTEIHTVFGVPNEFGFTDLLKDPTDERLDQAIRETSVDRLHIITSGSFPENPWELFRSSNLHELSRLLLLRADYILYDTPSSLMFTDALNLAPVVDAALLCVRAFEPLTGAEERLVNLLEAQHVPVLGSILSDIPPAIMESYPNNEHYYATPPAVPAHLSADESAQPVIKFAAPSKNGRSS